MLTTLTLDGYRSFRHYEVEGLSLVNLFVGKNNCGKTSLLEGVEFLASKGSPSALLRSPATRGEQTPTSDPETPIRFWATNIAHLFHGRKVDPESGSRLEFVGSPDYGPISVTVRPLTLEERNGNDERLAMNDDDDLPLGLEIVGSYLHPNPVMAIGWDGSLLSRHRLGPERPSARLRPPRTLYLAPRSLTASDMRSMWDRVLIKGRQSEVNEAIRLVSPGLESLHFLVGDTASTSRRGLDLGAAGILANLQDDDRPVPLGSLGDGIRRLLALSLSLIDTTDGFLLADEIDSGLHWTVMPDLWSLIIRTARKYSVQVFATTHSLDCITGLANLYRRDPELTGDVSVFKMDRRLSRAIRLSADNVDAAVQNGIEIR